MNKSIKIFIGLFAIYAVLTVNMSSVFASFINGDTIATNEEGELVAEEMTQEQQEATEEFIESTEVTDNFVVYADEFSQNCHLDGNMCVNELTTDTETTHYDWNNETQSLDIYTAKDQVECIKNSGQGNPDVYDEDGDELGDYSIVLNGNDIKVGVIEGGEILVGDNISVQNINDSSTFKAVELTGQSKDQVGNTIASTIVEIEDGKKEMTEEEKTALYNQITEEVKIDENLNKIGQSGAALTSAFASDNPAAAADYTKFQLLPSFNSDTTVVFTVLPADLENQEFANAIDNLLKANASVGAKIILNVSTNGEESLTISHPINGNGAYDISTGYLVWNFGDYAGNISYKFTTEGEIVAPNAIVNFNVMDGKIVAKKAIQGQGQEIHMPYTKEQKEKPKPDPEPTPDPEPEPTPTPEPEPTPTPTPTPEPKPTPVKPDKPTPIPPKEPEKPVVIPDTPVPTAPVGITTESKSEPLNLGEVLGLRRVKDVDDKAVLGERRVGPETGDDNLNLFLMFCLALFLSTAVSVSIIEKKYFS